MKTTVSNKTENLEVTALLLAVATILFVAWAGYIFLIKMEIGETTEVQQEQPRVFVDHLLVPLDQYQKPPALEQALNKFRDHVGAEFTIDTIMVNSLTGSDKKRFYVRTDVSGEAVQRAFHAEEEAGQLSFIVMDDAPISAEENSETRTYWFR